MSPESGGASGRGGDPDSGDGGPLPYHDHGRVPEAGGRHPRSQSQVGEGRVGRATLPDPQLRQRTVRGDGENGA